jgi:hypothetical protein
MANDLVTIASKWEQQAEQATANEAPVSSQFLSTKGGVLSFGDDVMPGNQVLVIIVDSINENTLYEGKYNADDSKPPVCYAFGRGVDDEMAPHESMQADLNYFLPQAETCGVCPMNEWGSADTGRGKACQNRRRLVLLPAGFYTPKRGSRDFDLEIFDEEDHFRTADLASIKLPVTSVKEWAKYVHDVATNFRRPPHGVITRVYLENDSANQYKVKFEVVEEVSDAIAEAVMARASAAREIKFQGYQPPQEKAPKPESAGGLRGLRRQGR